MPVAYLTHDDFLIHSNGAGHPERPDRLRAIWKHLDETGLIKKLKPLEFAHADPTRLARVHDPAYIASVEKACRDAPAKLDPDTGVVAESYDVARLASGAALAAVDAVMAGDVDRAFCCHRPPGHHAEHDRAMGFCLFNHVAVAAEWLTHHHKLERVAIVDFDVHHGNGTQHAFEERADVLFVSIHEDPRYCYPGTGHATETGKGAGEGFTLNVPMPPGARDDAYERAFDGQIIQKLDAYKPQVLLISAGFDAAAADPLAHIELTTAGFRMMTQKLVAAAERHCAGRIVSVLEGGYDLRALAEGVAAHLEALSA